VARIAAERAPQSRSGRQRDRDRRASVLFAPPDLASRKQSHATEKADFSELKLAGAANSLLGALLKGRLELAMLRIRDELLGSLRGLFQLLLRDKGLERVEKQRHGLLKLRYRQPRQFRLRTPHRASERHPSR
jgi:hypothetical protein